MLTKIRRERRIRRISTVTLDCQVFRLEFIFYLNISNKDNCLLYKEADGKSSCIINYHMRQLAIFGQSEDEE